MLKFDDDGGSFERILREAEKAANGDESLKLSLLTRKIVYDFVDKQKQASAAASLLIMREEEEEEAVSKESKAAKFDNLGFRIPKRRRGTVTRKLPLKPATMPPSPPSVLNKKKITLKRCFDQTQNIDKEEPVIRKPKRQKKEKGNCDQQEQVPDMPECFKNRIQEENGTDVVLVMQKHITSSDLRKNLNRLSIPRNKIRADDFIDEEEKKMAKREKGIPVLLIPPSLKKNVTLDLKWWSMNNTFTYNLKEKWHSCVVDDEDNGLKIGSKVQLWRFRKNIKDLCFALVKVQ